MSILSIDYSNSGTKMSVETMNDGEVFLTFGVQGGDQFKIRFNAEDAGKLKYSLPSHPDWMPDEDEDFDEDDLNDQCTECGTVITYHEANRNEGLCDMCI